MSEDQIELFKTTAWIVMVGAFVLLIMLRKRK